MIWVFGLIALGLVGFIAELWIDYQTQADRLVSAIELTQRQTADQRQHIERVRQQKSEIQKRMVQLEQEKAALQADVNLSRQQLVQMEEQARRNHPTLFLFELSEETI